MSTFDGIVGEFPDIRIDNFRNLVRPCAVRACFLSHVHSDHLQGLESFNGSFIYCSPATREILLRLEKYPNRMNFASGILEQRKQTYKHLTARLKSIPLEVPTWIELVPGRKIRVTLFDANHCPGAVMFLIEDEERSILYTGDIRSEDWWVKTLLRNPILLPFVACKDKPPLQRLDNIYLDTTFANKDDHYKQFPSKANGMLELLRKVSQYPKDTLFYFDTWTFGYEEVWQALSSFLRSRIHVDQYRHRIYLALAQSSHPDRGPEGAKLIGVHVGNHFQHGCLSVEPQRIHSCEKGTGCDIWRQGFVQITPIVTRYNGVEYGEAGAGGGHGDLNAHHELELDTSTIIDFLELCTSRLSDKPQIMSRVREILKLAMQTPAMTIQLDACDMMAANDEGDRPIPIERVVDILAKHVTKAQQSKAASVSAESEKLPKQITFPYSRHSSYGELCLLLEAFKPKDVHPCTVDVKNWTAQQSMSHLFGHIFEPDQRFGHDQKMLRALRAQDVEFSEHSTQSSSLDQRADVTTQPWVESRDESKSPQSLPREHLSHSGPNIAEQKRLQSQRHHDRSSSPKRKRSKSRTKLSPQLSCDSGAECEERRNRRSSPVGGDFWPPREEVIHYSPPRKRRRSCQKATGDRVGNCEIESDGSHGAKRRISSLLRCASPPNLANRSASALEPGYATKIIEDQMILTSWSQPPCIDDTIYTHERSSNRWQKHIAASRRASEECDVPSTYGCRSQSEAYGRLSPPLPPEDVNTRCAALLTQPRSRSPDPGNYRCLSSVGQTSKPERVNAIDNGLATQRIVALEGQELKDAIKQEVTDAVLGNGPLYWSDIGLVTVTGHQEESQEL